MDGAVGGDGDEVGADTWQAPEASHECASPLDRAGSSNDEARALEVFDDGSFVVAGAILDDDESGQMGWGAGFDASGASRWELSLPASQGSSRILALARREGDGGLWALLETGNDEVLLRLSVEGDIEGELLLSERIDDAELGVSIKDMSAVEGSVWLTGRLGGDLWVGRLDLEHDELETVLVEDQLGYIDTGMRLARAADELAVAAKIESGPSSDGDLMLVPPSHVLLVRFDLDGHELGRTALGEGEPLLAADIHALVADGEGSWVVAGVRRPTNELLDLGEAWVEAVGAEQAWEWTRTSVLEDEVRVEALLAGDGEVLALGSESGQAWAMGLGRDGVPRWEYGFDDEGFDSVELLVAAWDPRGSLRTGGRAWLGQTPSLRTCLVVPP
ncbi:hypothetical protein G6O69_03490 [Pseudenhygromyxa sp. WMMC2535]|uniref:hypothetical protein n=1 Tax=Pseudenhygromyxa sp. WMMC2535 TaxID=2712867 RepID=UPI0015957BB4|nr:hypothetical protein [Pseudenhygromyxa sp. WMMC2535]NVB36878.1 hypothetical protein [Pseudenhygromyxa sp. WMMC2535]